MNNNLIFWYHNHNDKYYTLYTDLFLKLEVFVPATVLVAGYAGVPGELVKVWGVTGVVDTGQQWRWQTPVQEARPVETLINN